ncbi:MAG: type IV pilin protein [Pseudomonadota bacterium]
MKNNGFTLIEMMIVVAIIGLLASIAWPNYQQYLKKSARTDAKTALLGLQQAQEKLRANCSVYGTILGIDNDCTPGDAANTTVNYSAETLERWYDIDITSANSTGYVATATAKDPGKQSDDTGCTTLTFTVNAANPNGLREPTTCW